MLCSPVLCTLRPLLPPPLLVLCMLRPLLPPPLPVLRMLRPLLRPLGEAVGADTGAPPDCRCPPPAP